MSIGSGYKYITFSLPNVSGASVGTQGDYNSSTIVTTFTCQEDVQGTYVNVSTSALTSHDGFFGENYILTLVEK